MALATAITPGAFSATSVTRLPSFGGVGGGVLPVLHIDHVGGILLFAAAGHSGADALGDTHHGEHHQVLELAGGDLLALLVLRDEADVHAGHHLADVDARLQLGLGGTALHTLDRRGEGAQTVPLHRLSALEQLHHHLRQTLDHALHDVTRVDRLVHRHSFNQTAQTQRVWLEGFRIVLAVGL